MAVAPSYRAKRSALACLQDNLFDILITFKALCRLSLFDFGVHHKRAKDARRTLQDESRLPVTDEQPQVTNRHILLCLRDLVASNDGKGAPLMASGEYREDECKQTVR